MRNFGSNKYKWRNILQSKPALVTLLIIVLVFAWSVLGLWGKMRDTSKNRQIAEVKIAELRQQKEKLASDINRMETTPGMEESIRDKFGFAKEGEGLIVIVDEKPELEVELEANTSGFWSFFTGWFK